MAREKSGRGHEGVKVGRPHQPITLGEWHEARLQNAGQATWSRQEVQAGGAGGRKVRHEQRVGGGVRG